MRAAIALAWLLCLTHVIAIAASKIEVTSKAVRQSVVKALPLLARTGPTTFKKSGCVSCHNQSLPAVAMAMARERGLTVEEEAVREILRTSVAAFGLDAETRLQMGEVLGRTITIGYALLGLAAENHRPDKATDSMALWTARTQFADGSWHDSDHRPPMEYSRFTATALGLRSLQLYGPPTRREEFEGRVELAPRLARPSPTPRHRGPHVSLVGLGMGRCAGKGDPPGCRRSHRVPTTRRRLGSTGKPRKRRIRHGPSTLRPAYRRPSAGTS